MLVVTTDGVPGREAVEALGLVRGSTLRAKHIGADIAASLRNFVGGEIREYAALLAGAREQGFDRLMAAADRLGADAVVAMRMETSQIQSAASEVVCYGTAVRLR